MCFFSYCYYRCVFCIFMPSMTCICHYINGFQILVWSHFLQRHEKIGTESIYVFVGFVLLILLAIRVVCLFLFVPPIWFYQFL
jgi:hypothetical protein